MSAVAKKRKVYPTPPSIKVYFLDNDELRKQIYEDAERFGVSLSIMTNMYIKAGRPLVVKALEKVLPDQVN